MGHLLKTLICLPLLLMGCGGNDANKPARNKSLALVAPCTGVSPDLLAPTWADVAACHESAADGDTITVAPGTYAVTAKTSISKYVKIVAAPGTVTLTDNTCAAACDNVDMIAFSESPSGSIVLQGFTITQGTAIHQAPAAVITMYRFSAPVNTGKPIIIKSNIYNPVANGDFIHASTNKGLIYGNSLDATALIHSSGGNCRAGVVGFVRHKLASAGPEWSSPSTFGASDATGENHLYIENNTLINVVENPLDSDDYGRTVFRFNTVVNGGLATHGVDTSGTGLRYAEIYGNTFKYDGRGQPNCHIAGADAPLDVTGFIGLRGGTNLIGLNTFDDINSGGWWGDKAEILMYQENIKRNAGPYHCWSTMTAPGASYPAPRQIGWGFTKGATNPGGLGVTQDLEPIYFFANTGSAVSTGAFMGISDYPINECATTEDVSRYIQENREFYKAASGPRASRSSTCTIGSAYWSTDQGGDWNKANTGANDGTLDKCTTANTWTNNWYTPYAYPHPLSSGTISPTPPVSPVITTQPMNQTVAQGQAALFSVIATGNPTPTYQWRRASVAITGATSSVYTTAPTVLTDNGAMFDVVVSNSAGSVTSTASTLTVTTTAPPPPPPPPPTGDTTPPVVRILVPTSGSTISAGKVQVTVNATDASEIGAMWLIINGQVKVYIENSDDLRYVWNTRPYKGKQVQIEARAWDVPGNQASHLIQVNVK